MALLAAGLTLAACESVYAWALRWYHPPAYYLLSAALTLLFSGAVGLILCRIGATAAWAVVPWALGTGWLVEGPSFGVALALGAAVCALWRRRESSPAAPLVGVAAGAGIVLALLRSTGMAEAISLLPYPKLVMAGFLFAAVLFGAAFLAGRSLLSDRVLAGLILLVALGLCLHPVRDAPTGRRRLPREPDLRSLLPDAGERPHIFLIVLDTLGADHMSVYGYGRETTPELARLLAERPNARAYDRAYANGTWTVPSHASLFTGLNLAEHGVHFDKGGDSFRYALNPDQPTLAEKVKGRGYVTLGVFTNNWLRIIHGIDRGYDRFFRGPQHDPLPFVGERLRSLLLPGLMPEVVKGGTRAADITDGILSVVDPWSKGENPLFVFANYGDTHGPYAPPPGFRGKFQPASTWERSGHLSILHSQERIRTLESRYDEELLYMDHHLGRLFDELDRRGFLDSSWVFVTSDHGEAFGQHGVTEHGTTVYDEVVRVPLIVFPPMGESLPETDGPVSLIDVAATVAAVAGVEELDWPGRDLRLAEDPQHVTRVDFYGDAFKARLHGELAAHAARSVLRGRFKLIEVAGRLELYDLIEDPLEKNDLSAERPDLVEDLRPLLAEWKDPYRSPDLPQMTEDDKERLQKLGYVGPD